mmetsp:Transcript_107666/g.286595  ORF Transcript_107666/g.286595 Transcript_107666/m.286595 type:complete len:257 (-) Transcript_107666:36-806(-)
MEREAQCGAMEGAEVAHLVPSPDPQPGAALEDAAAPQPEEEAAVPEPGLASQQPDEEADEAGDLEEQSPKSGRRRRRRRHRRGAADKANAPQDSSDDESHPSQESASVVGVPCANRNVVTWSDLGGDCVLKKALPVGRVVSNVAPTPPPHPPQCVSMPAAWEVPAAPCPPEPQVRPLAWPMGWACAPSYFETQGWRGAAAMPYSYIAQTANAMSPWTEKDSAELRQWLCKGFSGGMPGLPELAVALQSVATESYED